jgi:hypothetical protein
MTSIFRAIDGRTLRSVSVAVIGAAMLAACDSDRAVAPSTTPSAKTPISANPAGNITTGTVVIKTGGPNGSLLTGAVYNVSSAAPAQFIITDNGPGDYDLTPGVITLKGVPVSWDLHVCQVLVPAGYEIDHEPCQVAKIYTNSTTTLEFFSAPFLSASWDVRNWYGWIMYPSGFTIQGPRGLSKTSIADNGPNDLDKRLGHLTFKFGVPGVWTLCQTLATAGHYIASPACRVVDDSNGRGVWAGTFVEPDAQVPNTP